MRQISVVEKYWIDEYIKKSKEVSLRHLIMKKGLDEKGIMLRKRKHKEMIDKEKLEKIQ